MRARWIGVVGFALVFGLVLVVLRGEPSATSDQGTFLSVAGRMLDGDDLYADVIENLYASDLAFLQDLYRRVNQEGHARAAVTCPACRKEFSVDLTGGRLGES